MSKHSPRPWTVKRMLDADGFLVNAILDANGQWVSKTPNDCPEDAHLIVACVNACAGIPQDVLDSPYINEFLRGMPAMQHRTMLEWTTTHNNKLSAFPDNYDERP